METVCGRSPVVLEPVGDHLHPLREHHGHARSIVSEKVVDIATVVRVHEVQAVSIVCLTPIVLDHTVVNELEVDAIPMTRDVIVRDRDTAGRPEVDAVSGGGLGLHVRAQRVALDAVVADVRQVDPEEAVLDAIVLDDASARLRDTDGGAILDEARADIP